MILYNLDSVQDLFAIFSHLKQEIIKLDAQGLTFLLWYWYDKSFTFIIKSGATVEVCTEEYHHGIHTFLFDTKLFSCLNSN